MKTRIILSILLVSVFFTGCKNDKSADSQEAVKPEVVDNTFKVTLNVIVKKDDDFCLYYTEDGSINFKDNPIWVGVKGNENIQKVVYSLPKDVFPTELRLDFGLKKDQEDIILKSVAIEYKGKKREINGAEMATFFRADDSKCSFDASTGLIKAVVKNGEKQCSSLYPHETLLKPEIEKLAH